MTTPATTGTGSRIGFRTLHVIAVVVLAGTGTLVLHSLDYILTAPLWLDELWVASSVHFPISDLSAITSTTPIGWNLLQQAFYPLGDEAPRLLALIFTALCPAAAYLLGHTIWRGTPLERMATGAVAAVAVACTPPMLWRNDLKQYTTDALIALIVLTLVVVAAREKRPRALLALAVVSAVGFLLSLTVVFVAAAGFAALLAQAALARDVARLRSSLVAGVAAGAGIVLQYLSIYAPSRNGRLDEYWADAFPAIENLPTFLFQSLGGLYRMYTWEARTAIAATLVLTLVVSTALLWRAGDRAAALTTPILIGGMILAGITHVYPLFDTRTSTFISVLLVALVAITAARVVHALVRLGPVRLRGPLLVATSVGLVLLAAVPMRLGLRAESIPAESTRQQVEFVQQNSSPNDLIVTNIDGALSLTYYWPELGPEWTPLETRAYGWDTVFPGSSPQVVRVETLSGSLTDYLVTVANDPAIERVWIIETHSPIEGLADAEQVLPIRRIDTGAERLAVFEVDALVQPGD